MTAKLPCSGLVRIARTVVAGILLAVATALLIAPARSKNSGLRSPDGNPKLPIATYAQLPLSFEANKGQTDRQVKFISRGDGYVIFLTPSEAVLSMKQVQARSPRLDLVRGPDHLGLGIGNEQRLAKEPRQAATNTFLTMRVVGANPSAEMVGLNAFPGKSNYFIGNNPKMWRTGVSNYARVICKEIYPGVDLVYYGNQRQLEYDFVLAPGADPSRIDLVIAGDRQEPISAQQVAGSTSETRKASEGSSKEWSSAIDSQQDLVIRGGTSVVRFHKPVVYQPTQADGQSRTLVEGHYVLKADNHIGFEVGAYDRNRPLVIDPTLSYSTYLGGSGDDSGLGIAVDSEGNAYVTGYTESTNFPTEGPIQASYAGGADDVFVSKFDPTGSTLLYSTYLGGAGDDVGEGIAVDSSGNAYVTGYTNSTDFPTMNAFQAANGGGYDAFVTKVNSTGTALVYATYLGGKGNDYGYGITIDSSGNAYVAGQTGSGSFPKKLAFQKILGGKTNAFVTKFNAAGTALVYSTYLGGSDSDRAYGVAVDSSGSSYVTGSTNSTNFPTKNPIQPALGGYSDIFITKFNPAGSALVYSTYLGGKAPDSPSSIVVDSAGNAYVAGGTMSSNFPTQNPFQATKLGTYNAIVTEVNATGTAWVFSTYLGGSLDDFGGGIGVDGSGNVYVGGYTRSTNFPTENPIQLHLRGSWNMFVTEFAPGGGSLVFSTYLGGNHLNYSYGLALDSSANVYATGGTEATNFPIKNAFQSTNAGGFDAFAVKITH
jgi:Beta-propeller repeat